MKSAASKVVLRAICVIFLGALTSSKGDTCQCAKPPGGEITCPSGYAAFCRVYDGKIFGECELKPKGFTVKELNAWVLSKVFGTRVKPAQIEANAVLEQTMKTGRYQNPKTREVITFTLPKENNL